MHYVGLKRLIAEKRYRTGRLWVSVAWTIVMAWLLYSAGTLAHMRWIAIPIAICMVVVVATEYAVLVTAGQGKYSAGHLVWKIGIATSGILYVSALVAQYCISYLTAIPYFTLISQYPEIFVIPGIIGLVQCISGIVGLHRDCI